MAVNKWRYVSYTDDGCCLWQCLACYRDWEGRTNPGAYDMDHSYLAVWKYCPYCGCEWESAVRSDFCNTRMLGQRRHKIELAMHSADVFQRKWSEVRKERCWIIDGETDATRLRSYAPLNLVNAPMVLGWVTTCEWDDYSIRIGRLSRIDVPPLRNDATLQIKHWWKKEQLALAESGG